MKFFLPQSATPKTLYLTTTCEQVRALMAGCLVSVPCKPQPTRSTNPRDFSAEPGEVVVLNGKPVKLLESRGRDMRDSGVLTYRDIKCPIGDRGDTVLIREPFMRIHHEPGEWRADKLLAVKSVDEGETRWPNGNSSNLWLHQRFMPRELWLHQIRVTHHVCFHRLQETTPEDAARHGFGTNRGSSGLRYAGHRVFVSDGHPSFASGVSDPALSWFASCWDEMHYKTGFGWHTNPWVFTAKHEFSKRSF